MKCQRNLTFPRNTACSSSAKGKNAVVVGGGIGGLVAAAKLSREGFHVKLVEKNSEVGGRCQSVYLSPPPISVQTAVSNHPSGYGESNSNTNTFRFDTGPSLLLFPETYFSTYNSLGVKMEDYVQLKRVQPAAYRVFFEGKGEVPWTNLDMLYDVQQMMEQLEEVEMGAGSNYLEWLSSARAALEAGMSAFIKKDFNSPLDILDIGPLLPLLPRLNPLELLGQHHSRIARRFKDERLCALFTFQDLYVGLSPYNAPGAFSLLAVTELTDGVWYPVGGFQKIRDSLCTIARDLGVEVLLQANVKSIDTSVDGQRVIGVELDSGQKLKADVVVANRDLPLAYGLLQGGAHTYGQEQKERISGLDYSAGVIAYNWCLNRKLNGLRHHNVFLSSNYSPSWKRATNKAGLQSCPNFYVHCPTRTDSTAAPEGCESLMILLPVANLREMALSGEACNELVYAELVEAGKEAILNAFYEAGVMEGGSIEMLRNAVVKEVVTDPQQWASRYSLQHGAAFGLAHGLNQLALMRPSPKDPKITGLYFTGASTRPGNGVPLVMISADLAVKRVIADLKNGNL